MKKILLLFILLLLYQCSNNQKYYHGYVYDKQTGKPIKSVLVKEDTKNNPVLTYTDTNGYFNIPNKKDFLFDLIFIANEYKIDTAVTVWSQRGEKLKYKFLNDKADTIYLHKK